MKKLYVNLALAAAFVAAIGTANAQQCLTGGCAVSSSQWPAATQTTTSTTFTVVATDLYAGDYSVFDVTNGVSYEWSLCAADGGSASYDSELTLMHGTSNAAICYSNDACGNDAKIGWTATFTGTVKVQINVNGCGTNSTNTTMVWRVLPTGTDAAVGDIYTLGIISANHSNPHVVRARIVNTGATAFTNIPVTLTVSGANTFTNTQTIASLASGAGAIVTFAGFNSTNTGTNTITITIPDTDDNPANNAKTITQTVGNKTASYAYGTTPAGGVGSNSGVIMLGAKFSTSMPTTLEQARAYFTTAGRSYVVRVYDATGTGGAPGALLHTSAVQTTTVGLNTVAISPALSVSGDFHIVIVQNTSGVNVALGYETETPIRPGSFYLTGNLTTPAWSDFSVAGANFKPMIEAVLSCITLPAPGAITGTDTVCQGSTNTYTVPAVTGATSYNWTLPTGWTGTSTTNTITATAGSTSGAVTVAASDGTCTSPVQTLNVTVNAQPAVPTITAVGNELSSSAATGNQWTLNGTPIAGATGQTHTATESGTYSVTVTNASGCSATSATFSHTMVGLQNVIPGVQLSVYPNPASSFVQIVASNTDQDLMVELTTIVGSSVMRTVAPAANGQVEFTLNTGSISRGVYLLTVSSKLGSSTSRLVIQ